MSLEDKFNKALLLLNYGDLDRAERILKGIAEGQQSLFEDKVTQIKAKCCLGEKLYADGRFSDAEKYLNDVASANIDDPRFDRDLIDFEIRTAKKLLSSIRDKKSCP